MANEEHLQVVIQGVSTWNQWRADYPDELPDLTGANLGGARLRDAHLMSANLVGANLDSAILYNAYLGGTVLADLNLTNTVGLERCQHHSPSTIDHRTLTQSGPDTPDFCPCKAV